jgi:fatty-acyl-CoA synthase
VVLSQSALRANLRAIAGPSGLSLSSDDVGVSWLPLYHDMGLVGALLTGLFVRGTTIIMSPVLFLKRPTAWLDAISNYRGTISFAPNFAYDLCLRRVKPSQIAALDLSSWRVAGCGAEPISSRTLEAFADRFECAGFRRRSFVPSYGLAEHSLAVSFGLHGLEVDVVDSARLVRESRAVPSADQDGHAVRLVACGAPFPDHALQIVDDEGCQLPERHVGHILVKGPSVMSGYFENAIATAEALQDGWLRTGDLGYIADNQLFVCGRTKDLIIRHGRKYHPPDLEAAIAAIPGLRPASIVVFGVSHLAEADRVVAVVEARASSASRQLTDDVRRRIRETAGLELDEVLLIAPGTIPRTTSGKVRRSEMRDRFESGVLQFERQS